MKAYHTLSNWLLTVVLSVTLLSCVGGDPTGDDPTPTPPPTPPTPPDTPTYSVNGSVQKGPFTQGTNITIQPLDENFNPTGKLYQTKTTNDTGMFSVGSEIESRYVEIIATGYYYNEIEGKVSSSTLSLRSISDLTETGKTNVNLLTTLESDRIRELLKDGGTLSEARSTAEREILEVFHIADKQSVCFDKMDITGGKDADAILLAISASLQAGRTVGELSELISKIAGDISESGKLTSANLATQITQNGMLVNAEEVRNNLRNRYSQLGVQNFTIPPFEDYLDINGNGVIDKEDTWIILGEKEATIGAEGGSFTISLQHSKPFEVIIDDATWVRQEQSRAYLEEKVLRFVVDANEDADERKATIRVKDSESNFAELFHLTQHQKDYLDPAKADYTLPFESGTLEIPVSVNVDYTVGIQQTGEWLHYVETRALRNETLVFNYDYNGSPSPRSATITLTAEGKSTNISILQGANEGEIVLTVKTPGTLATLMSEEDMHQIVNLKIVGTLNDNDLVLLLGGKYVGGSNVIGGGEAHFECDWKVETLDLSEMKSESGAIGTFSFFGCVPSLKKVIMPKEVTTIGYNAFNMCINLETIEWGEDSEIEVIQGAIEASSLPGVSAKYYGAFKECISLEEVTLPKSIKTFMAGAFMNCTSLKRLIFPNDGYIKALECAFSITSTGISTTRHPMGHLWGCNSLETIVLPDNLREIGIDAFYGTPFRTIVIPETVKHLPEEGLFYGCSRLEEVTLPSSVTEYSKDMFAGCVNLQSIKGTGKITKYCEGCFAGCDAKWVYLDPEVEYETGVFAETNVESVTFPAGFKTIPNEMFYKCANLKQIDLGEVETIGARAFYGCAAESITLPMSVKSVGEDSFYGENLKEITIYSEELSFPYGICGNKVKVTIGNTVRRLSGKLSASEVVFEEGSVCEHFCSMRGSKIKSITLPDCIKELDEKAFYWCEDLKSAKLPANLTTIPKSAFEHCTLLESITIPDGVVTIGEKAFYECKALEKITLPHTVSYIGSEAFRYCDYLEEIHLKSIEPPVLKSYWYEWDQAYYYPFDNCKYLDKIQVPDEGLAAYKASWSKYADIIVGGEPDGKHCETPFATVTTLDATNIGLFEAKLRGSLSMMTEVKDRIICFLISTDPNNLTTKGYAFPNGNTVGATLAADGSFECTCNNLQGGTTYYYRAYAELNPKLINNQWTGGEVFVGEVKSFTTIDPNAGKVSIRMNEELTYYRPDEIAAYDSIKWGHLASADYQDRAIVAVEWIFSSPYYRYYSSNCYNWEGYNWEFDDEQYINGLIWNIEHDRITDATFKYTPILWENRHVWTAIVVDEDGNYSSLYKREIYAEQSKAGDPAEFCEWWETCEENQNSGGLQSLVIEKSSASETTLFRASQIERPEAKLAEAD